MVPKDSSHYPKSQIGILLRDSLPINKQHINSTATWCSRLTRAPVMRSLAHLPSPNANGNSPEINIALRESPEHTCPSVAQPA